MSWRAPTEEDLQSCISADEDRLWRTKLLATAQGDPYASIISQVTLNFREAIRTNPSNTLDEDPATLPEGAIFHAMAIVRHRLSSRFNSTAPSEARMEEWKAAQSYLRDVAKANGLAIEQPGDVESAKQPIPPMAVNESPRRDGWRNQDGI
jgi:hypothetical protein